MPTPTEAQTRKTLIDPALTRAGWDLVVNGFEGDVNGRAVKISGHTYQKRMDDLNVLISNFTGLTPPPRRREAYGGGKKKSGGFQEGMVTGGE